VGVQRATGATRPLLPESGLSAASSASTGLAHHPKDARAVRVRACLQRPYFMVNWRKLEALFCEVYGYWANAQLTAADQARLFARLGEVVPRAHGAYVRRLLSSVVPSQSWAIPQASRPRWRTYFKGGWRSTSRGQLVHQAARLERGRLSVAIAVLTDGDPSHEYGVATVRGYHRAPACREHSAAAPGKGGSTERPPACRRRLKRSGWRRTGQELYGRVRGRSGGRSVRLCRVRGGHARR
jgi:hypothetical protein